jgi:ABC-2 type transport system permease protein
VSDFALAGRQIQFENRAFWRNPASAFFTFAFPLMFLVIFNLVFGNNTVTLGAQEVSQSTFYVAAIAAFSLVSACYTNIAISISFARDGGILKRIRGTPLPAWVYMAGRVIHAALIGVLLVVIVTLAGGLFYNVEIPTTTIPAVLVTILVGSATFCALGLAVTAMIPNADASPAVVNATILPLLFISDIFIPLDQAPSWLVTVASIFPVKHLSAAMQYAFNPFATGMGFRGTDLLVIALWGVAGVIAAVRFFDWEPRQ